MLRAEVVVRESWRVDEGTMGFHDYVTHKENFSDFVDRVLREANTHWKDGKCIANVQFVGEDKAVIMWEED